MTTGTGGPQHDRHPDSRGIVTNYSRREVTVTRIEVSVPALPEGQGYSYWGPLRRAILDIERDLGDAASYEDAVRIEARDDVIVLSYAKTEDQT